MRSSQVLREARLRAGLSQRQLGERLGIAQSAVARWERGGSSPSLETLRRLVGACGLELTLGLAVSDPDEASLIERNLALSPSERLDQLVRTVQFIQAGRAALADRG